MNEMNTYFEMKPHSTARMLNIQSIYERIEFIMRHLRELIIIDYCATTSPLATYNIARRGLVEILTIETMRQIDAGSEGISDKLYRRRRSRRKDSDQNRR